MFGIEEEFFIASSADRSCPALEQMASVFRALAQHENWELLPPPDTGAVWNSPCGKIGVWNDFSTNILEVAYPPLQHPDQFIELRKSAFERLDHVLQQNQLIITPGTVGNRRPEEIVLRPAPSVQYQMRLDLALQRPDNGRDLFCPYFYANICSTQVSLSASKSAWGQIVLGLYEYEHLVPLLYCRPPDRLRQKESFHCLRHFVLADNWPGDPYVGFPADIAQLMLGVEKVPQPRTVKYANCVYRPNDRIEFRSCDRLDRPETIMEMTCLRLLAMASATAFAPDTNEPRYRDLYVDACRNGAVCSGTVKEQLGRFRSVLQEGSDLIKQTIWQRYLNTLLVKVEQLADESISREQESQDVKL